MSKITAKDWTDAIACSILLIFIGCLAYEKSNDGFAATRYAIGAWGVSIAPGVLYAGVKGFIKGFNSEIKE